MGTRVYEMGHLEGGDDPGAQLLPWALSIPLWFLILRQACAIFVPKTLVSHDQEDRDPRGPEWAAQRAAGRADMLTPAQGNHGLFLETGARLGGERGWGSCDFWRTPELRVESLPWHPLRLHGHRGGFPAALPCFVPVENPVTTWVKEKEVNGFWKITKLGSGVGARQVEMAPGRSGARWCSPSPSWSAAIGQDFQG